LLAHFKPVAAEEPAVAERVIICGAEAARRAWGICVLDKPDVTGIRK
jgi:hypothetical protein